MNTKLRRFFGISVNLLLTAIFIYLLVYPQAAVSSSKNAVTFCIGSIIPSLYIYLVLSQRIVAITAVSKLCAHKRLGTVFTVALGFLCGFPSGARNCVYLYNSGVISREKGEYMCCLCGSPSVSFILAFAGSQVMGSTAAGVKLLAFQVISTAVTALIIRPFMLKKDTYVPPAGTKKYIRKTDLTDAISDSAYLLVRICGFVCAFFVLGSIAESVLPAGSIWGVIFRGLLEFSGGVYCASEYGVYTREVLCSLFLGFGSLSAVMQTASVIKGVFSLKPFIISRFLIATLMTLFALLT